MLASSDVGSLVLERDGAGANDVLATKVLKDLPETVLASDSWCYNHKEGLCEASVVKAIGVAAISSMYSVACMLRMGSIFLRLVLFVDVLIGLVDQSHVVRGRPARACQAYVAELQRYALWHDQQTWAQRTKRRADDADDVDEAEDVSARDASLRRRKEALDNYFGVSNCEFGSKLR